MTQAAADASSAAGHGAAVLAQRDGPAGLHGLPVLYSFRRCPYAMRARLAIAASRQRCELREVVLRDKPPSLIAASPKATVPVLVLPDGTVLAQSLDIMRWALGCHDPEGWLPQSPPDIGLTDALIARCDGEFKQHLDRFKYPNRYRQEDAQAELDAFAATHRTGGAAFLARLEGLLGAAGPGEHPRFLVGERWSIADAAIAPFVRQFAATEPAWFDAQAWPALQAWLAAFCASPRLVAVMDRHPPWREGAPGVPFPG
jgi:glutathione S-transferase